MRRVYVIAFELVLAGCLIASGWAKDFKLLDGSSLSGELSDANEIGAVFRLSTGGFSTRTAWTKFSQESLKELLQYPKAKPLVEPFIEIPIEAKPKPKPIVLREAPRVERPVGRVTFFSSFTAPLGLALLGVLYLANLLAAYETAIYRNRPIALVCGLSALLPLAGPLIFLASPSVAAEPRADLAGDGYDAPPPPPGPAVAAAGGAASTTSRRVGVPQAPAGGGLRVAAGHDKAGAAGKYEVKVFNRTDYTFNRRFIETQFSGFFRVVPGETEKDLVLVVKTPKHEYVGKRISRISSNEFFMQLQQGGGTKEVSVGFGEIVQIEVKHKDDKD